jgi:hypothetical protein
VRWPEKVLLGRYVVRGESPPFVIFPDNPGKTVGEHQKPVVQWLESIPIHDPFGP